MVHQAVRVAIERAQAEVLQLFGGVHARRGRAALLRVLRAAEVVQHAVRDVVADLHLQQVRQQRGCFGELWCADTAGAIHDQHAAALGCELGALLDRRRETPGKPTRRYPLRRLTLVRLRNAVDMRV